MTETNAFNELKVRELNTQWKHKVSVTPPSEGVTARWWDATSGVTRDGPAAKIPGGEHISTRQSGEYIVGDPALAGGSFRLGSTLPAEGSTDDAWCGYTNRFTDGVSTPDGVGVGVTYFAAGEGDAGGADSAGVQPYAWFRSSVATDKTVPADQWNQIDGDWRTIIDIDNFRYGAFVRIPFTFYNEGSATVRIGDKTDHQLDTKEAHTFVVDDGPMWGESDLQWQQATTGSVTSYVDAAHFKAGEKTDPIRSTGIGRGGGLGGSVNFTEGEWYPLLSFRLRDGWENVNLQPLSFTVDASNDLYVQLTINADLDSNASFGLPGDTASSEAAAEADNTATGFASTDRGEREYFRFVSTDINTTGLTADFADFALAPGDTVTLMAYPVTSSTTFNGASLLWGGNF